METASWPAIWLIIILVASPLMPSLVLGQDLVPAPTSASSALDSRFVTGLPTPLPLAPGDLLAGPFPLSGTSPLGICFLPDSILWGQPVLYTADLYSGEAEVYDALTLQFLSTINSPQGPSTTTGITTDGIFLYWAIAPTGLSFLYRSDLDGANPVNLGQFQHPGGGLLGDIAMASSDSIWVNDIVNDSFHLMSAIDGSWLGESHPHPDGSGYGNGVAYRAGCGLLEIPHGSDNAGRVVMISVGNPVEQASVAPIDISTLGTFLNGIETSRPFAPGPTDLFGVYSIYLIDNAANLLFVIEGNDPCPSVLPPLGLVTCSTDGGPTATIDWQPLAGADGYRIWSRGLLLAELPGDATSFETGPLTLPVFAELCVEAFEGSAWTPLECCTVLLPGCIPPPITLSHNADPDLLTPGSVNCSVNGLHDDNSYWRTFSHCGFPFGLNEPISVLGVRFGIENSIPGIGFDTQPVVVRIHSDPDGGDPAPISSLQLLYEETFEVPPVASEFYCASLATPFEIDCSTDLVVEIFTPDGQAQGHLFYIGSSASPQTLPSYLSAPDCGIPDAVDLALLGFPDMHLTIDLLAESTVPPGLDFSRGDTNDDSLVNIADAVFLLNALFIPGSPQLSCDDSGDVNDDGGKNIADAVWLLNWLFVPGSPLPMDPVDCGLDPTADSLDCSISTACP